MLHDSYKSEFCLYCIRRRLYALALEKDLSIDVVIGIAQMLGDACEQDKLKKESDGKTD